MAEPIAINVQQAPKAAPATYTVPGAIDVEPLGAFAFFDGTAAASAFICCYTVRSDGGLVIGRYFPTTSVSAGGTAFVSYFPGVGVSAATGGGSAGTVQVPIILDTPDANGDGYPALTTNQGFTNVRRAVPTLAHATIVNVATWEGSARIPQNYSSTPVVVLTLTSNNTLASKAARIRVSTAVVANGVTENTAYTDEAYVAVTIPTTANQRFDQSYALSTTPVAGSTLNVKVSRDANNAADTLTGTDVLIWECLFQYTSA